MSRPFRPVANICVYMRQNPADGRTSICLDDWAGNCSVPFRQQDLAQHDWRLCRSNTPRLFSVSTPGAIWKPVSSVPAGYVEPGRRTQPPPFSGSSFSGLGGGQVKVGCRENSEGDSGGRSCFRGIVTRLRGRYCRSSLGPTICSRLCAVYCVGHAQSSSQENTRSFTDSSLGG